MAGLPPRSKRQQHAIGKMFRIGGVFERNDRSRIVERGEIGAVGVDQRDLVACRFHVAEFAHSRRQAAFGSTASAASPVPALQRPAGTHSACRAPAICRTGTRSLKAMPALAYGQGGWVKGLQICTDDKKGVPGFGHRAPCEQLRQRWRLQGASLAGGRSSRRHNRRRWQPR